MLKKYLFTSFTSSFFPIFLSLFSITSIIYLVKIASLTSVIQLNFSELLLLYGYNIPKILFFTLPISFIMGLTISMSRLSGEYELLVISSFGKNPIHILKYFIPVALALSFTLLIISQAIIPKATFLNKKFIASKKTDAQFNIKASKFGQEFGNWLIFIKEDKDKVYKDVKLLQKGDKHSDRFIMASSALMDNKSGNLNLNLYDGKSFIINNQLDQTNYAKMLIMDNKKDSSFYSFNGIAHYWKDIYTNNGMAENFVFNILISIFPLISILFILIFAYYNPRYEKNHSVLYSSILIVIFFIISKKLITFNPFILACIIPTIWILTSYLLYYKTIRAKY